MRDVLLLQKFYQVREFRIWQKDNLLFQQTLFTGVILINNIFQQTLFTGVILINNSHLQSQSELYHVT